MSTYADKRSADHTYSIELGFTRLSRSHPFSLNQRKLRPQMTLNLMPYLHLEIALTHLWQLVDQEVEHFLHMYIPPACIRFNTIRVQRWKMRRIYSPTRAERP